MLGLLTLWLMAASGGSDANGMICPEVNENSTIAEENLAWMCELMKWRSALLELKLRVEQDCSVNDEDEYWRSVFECPDFSEINCVNQSSLQHETDLFNCSISYCGDGNYVDQTFFKPIWIHHHNLNKKFMLILRNLSHCIDSAGSSLNVTCPYLEDNATEAEMNEAWMCEFVKWRDILAEWKNRVEEQCSVSDEDSNWESAFECPNLSDIQCLYGTTKLNKTNKLNCLISLCEDGSYSDESLLRAMSRQQFKAREYIITTFTNNGLQCAIRDSTDATATANDGTYNSMTTTVNSIDFTIPVDSTSSFDIDSTADANYPNSESSIYSTMSTENGIAGTTTAKVTTASQFASTQSITDVITNSESTTEGVTSSSAIKASTTTDVTPTPELTTASVIPIGWESSGNLYYKCFTDVPFDYATAKANCGSYGGTLAAKVLRDPVAVNNIISKGYIGADWTTGEAPWVGFDDLSNEGDWQWVDGGDMDPATTVWSDGQPDNSGGNEHCGHLYQIFDGKIAVNDHVCSTLLHYICEVETEMHEVSTADVTTAPELHTALVIPIGWETSENLYYKCFTDVPVDYATAKANCGAYGGRLAAKVLRDPVAVNYIVGGCISTGLLWVGFDDIEMEGEWRWSDSGNTSYDTTEWDVGQPNIGVEENCANIRQGVDGKLTLHDYPCDHQFNYICEIETENSDVYIAEVTTAVESTTLPVDLVSWATSGNLHYKCFKDVRRTYAEAKSICGSYGGRLATKVLRDPVAVSDLIANGCDGGSIFDDDQWVWIGFDDVNSEGIWRWSDGGNMNNVTTEWSDTELNDQLGNEDCGSLWGSINGKLQLNDYICSEQLNYICEVENATVDCSTVDPENYKSGDENAGVFEIYSDGQNLDVYCDLRTDGGGWTVFQRRMDGSVDFYRNHFDYVNGFGNVSGEFRLGLDNLYHILQSHAQFQLRIDMEDWDGVQKYAKYSLFSIGNYSEDYQLAVEGYSGTAGDSFSHHNGMKFTTIDHDVDLVSTRNCAEWFKGGWWHKDCHEFNPNGLYHDGGYGSTFGEGINWEAWRGYEYSLKFVEMKVKPFV